MDAKGSKSQGQPNKKAHIERFNELENRDRPVIEDNVEISTLSLAWQEGHNN